MNLYVASQLSVVWVLALATALAALAFWLYRSELRRRSSGKRVAMTLPILRAASVWLIVVMLLEPSIALRHIEGEPNELVIVVDDSASMSRNDEDGKTRWQAAIDLITNPEVLSLTKLADRFNVRLLRSSGTKEELLWSADSKAVEKPPLPEQQLLKIEATLSAEGSSKAADTLQAALPMHSALGRIVDRYPGAVVLMLSDGVTTDGDSLSVAAQKRAANAPPLFFVGLGAESDVIDAKLLSISAPQQVDQLDSIAGEVRIEADPKLPAKLSIRHQDKVVWSTSLTADQLTQQRVPFSFPVKPLLDAADESSSVPQSQRSGLLSFTATLEQSPQDIEPRNNTASFHSWVSLLRNRVLLVDSRPRWETRYIRNALDRDPTWEVTAISIAEREGRDEFASIIENPTRLAEFDLVILGELDNGTLTETAQKNLHRYVADVGGGLIVIDGRLGSYRQEALEEMRDILPVEFRSETFDADIFKPLYQAIPTAAAKDQPTFMVTAKENSETFDWKSLPTFYIQSAVKAKPAATVLMNAVDETNNTSLPVFVEMRVGSGLVFYSASDQTWKWRYKQADAVHRRLWAQICRGYTRKPFLIHTPTIDLDVNAKIFRPQDSIPVRARLDSNQFNSQADRLVYAIITNDKTGDEQRFQMQTDTSQKNQFAGTVPALPPGEYTFRLETSGMTALQQAVSAKIIVADDARAELLASYQDRAAMQQAASSTDGAYFTLQQASELMDRLVAQSTGRVIRDNYALWKSYWWFVPLVVLLACEWLLRKRSGLI